MNSRSKAITVRWSLFFLRKLCPKRNENQDLKRPVAVMLILFPIGSMGVSVLALMMRKTMMSTLTLG
jgi:hypothetical protein